MPKIFHGGTGSRNGAEGIARRGGGEQFPGPVASRLPPAGLRRAGPDARTPAGEGAVEGAQAPLTSCGRILLPAAPRLSASGCGCAGLPARRGPAARKGSRGPAPGKHDRWAREWFQ